MTGPPPKTPATRRRRNITPGFRALPRAGRKGSAPEWPLSAVSIDEDKVWRRLWTMPQAVEWERMRCEDIVALYVRSFVAASQPDSPDTKLLAEVRQLDAKIGLSPKAMRDLRWETDEDAPIEEMKEELIPEPESERTFVPKTQGDK